MHRKYQVLVGNIGTVYNGDSLTQAIEVFLDYRGLSFSNYGRAAGEDVVVMCHDEPMEAYNYAGTLNQE